MATSDSEGQTNTIAPVSGPGPADSIRATSEGAAVLKEKLKEAKDATTVWEIIQKALSDLTRLQITTIVTREVTADGNPGTQTGEPLELRTSIDLLQADRTNTIPLRFLQDPALAPMREFHAEQVKLAQENLQQRLEFMQRLGAAIVEAINAVKAP